MPRASFASSGTADMLIGSSRSASSAWKHSSARVVLSLRGPLGAEPATCPEHTTTWRCTPAAPPLGHVVGPAHLSGQFYLGHPSAREASGAALILVHVLQWYGWLVHPRKMRGHHEGSPVLPHIGHSCGFIHTGVLGPGRNCPPHPERSLHTRQGSAGRPCAHRGQAQRLDVCHLSTGPATCVGPRGLDAFVK